VFPSLSPWKGQRELPWVIEEKSDPMKEGSWFFKVQGKEFGRRIEYGREHGCVQTSAYPVYAPRHGAGTWLYIPPLSGSSHKSVNASSYI